MLARHGGAIVLEKHELANSTKIAEAINTVLKDKSIYSYSMNARKLAEMLVNQPISAKQLMIRHAEFAAR
uniref:glucuronosyltransferase n=1 Tax=Angiostrongylus cantonensis TaxID=6313 RepID=A0A0K0DI60_ANGCA